jgi:hypothetical protein
MKSATSFFFQSLAFSLTTLTSLLVFSAQAQVPSYISTNGLIAYWPFNGNAIDVSGNGNNGNLGNTISVSDRFGNPSGAFY